MKLRSLWLGDYRNLQDVTLSFPEGARVPVYLIVGVNGTGKSGILRTLAHLFSALEYNQTPHIPFDLRYQIGRGSEIYEVHITGKGQSTADGLTFEVTASNGESSSRGRGEWKDYLPACVIAHTSGSLAEWLPALAESDSERERREHDQAEALRGMQKDGNEIEEMTGALDLQVVAAAADKDVTEPSRTLLLTPPQLQLALLATLAIDDPKTAKTRADIYGRVGLKDLSCFALRLQPLAKRSDATRLREEIWRLLGDRPDDPELVKRFESLTAGTAPVLPPRLMERVRALAEFAAHRHRNPDGSYHLLFEMVPEAREKLGGMFTTPNLFYNFLAELHEWRALAQVDLVLRKTDLADEILDRHLSDGEYALLTRLALFFLLGQPESLFLLDEPETHFNDVWKRELVDILATVLEKQSSTILLTTHSSIVLSDVPNEQITLLQKESGLTRVVDFTTPTLGADPSDILIHVLGADDSIGKDALEYLDNLLKREWTRNDLEELEREIRRIGPGYHRSELRTIWRNLSATQDTARLPE